MKSSRVLAPLSLIYILAALPASATSYYVGGTGASDTNPGTSTQPWATLQKAATVAVAGDVVNIRTGTYRETVTPSNSGSAGNPIIYQPDGNAIVTVSGADTANGGWTVHSGSIYKKTISLPVTGYNDHITSNTSLLANQVFVDGKMMIEARWPNVANSDDLLDRDDFRKTSLGTWTDTSGNDASIPNISGGWVGGTLWINGWYVSATRAITSHSGTQIGWSGAVPSNKRDYFYLTGKLGALDAEKEWFYDGAQLYLRAPGSGSPTNVEVKTRNWAFDLSGRSHITVKNLHIFAASIITNGSSTNITLDGLHAKYINHSVTLPNGTDVAGGYNDVLYSHTEETGIRLMGPNSVIRNSIVEYSSDQGIVLGGGNTADNNLLHDISYGGTYACAIAPAPHADGQQIKNNTVYRTGRSAIDFRENQNVNIEKNEFYDYGLINVDLGGIYAARQDNLSGTRIHYNWIHDSKVAEPAIGTHTGIYFDQGSGPTQCDHNVIWNNGSVSSGKDFYSHKYATGGNPHLIYNNTFVTADGSGDILSYKNANEGALVADDLKNNIFRDIAQNRYNDGTVHFDTISTPASNMFSTTTPTFVGSGGGGLAYRLASGSAGIDQGVVISGVTDGHSGSAPDKGAYEFNGTAWVPGYTVIAPAASPAAGTYGSALSVTLATRTVGATIRYTTDGSTPTPTSGTVYTDPINVASSMTVKAIAYQTGLKDSAVVTAAYTITGSTPDVLARYEFTSSSLASNDTNANSTAASFGAGTGYTNLSFNNNQRRVTGAGITGTAAQNDAAGEYFTTTTTATSGNVLNLSSFTFKAIRTTSSADHITVYAIPNGGPNNGQTLTVIDNAALTLSTLTTYNGSLTGAAYQGINGIEIRIVFHGSNAGNPTATNSVDDVILEGTASGGGGGGGLPSPWLNQDIGSVGIAGSASHASGTFTLNGSGADIWSTADEFHFVYQTMTGDGEIVARVTSVENTHSGAKAGVMIREALTANSKHVIANTTPLPQRQYLRRASTGGTTTYNLGGTAANPYWVRLVRAGNVFTAYESANGTSWTAIGTAQTITMATNVYVGLVVVSKDNAELNTSTFTNVTVTP